MHLTTFVGSSSLADKLSSIADKQPMTFRCIPRLIICMLSLCIQSGPVFNTWPDKDSTSEVLHI